MNNNNYIVKELSYDKFFCIVNESINNGVSVKLTVVGISMYPFLRNRIDSVELYKTDYENLKINDIIFAKQGNKCILHRLYKKYDDTFIMLGDGNLQFDSVYKKEDFICKASAIYRKDKRIPCESFGFKFLSVLWRILRPFRKQIFKIKKRLF